MDRKGRGLVEVFISVWFAIRGPGLATRME